MRGSHVSLCCKPRLAMHLLNDDLPPGKPLLAWHLQLVWIRRYYIHHHNYITGVATLQMEINYTQWKTNQINFYVLSLEDDCCPNLLSCRVWCSAREVSIPEHGFDRNAATQVHSLDSPNPSFPPWSCSSQSIYHCCYLYHCCSLKWFPLSYSLTTIQSHEILHREMGPWQNWHEFKMQIATCLWNMWEYRHSPIHACHGPVGGDKTPAFRVYEPCGRSIWADTWLPLA